MALSSPPSSAEHEEGWKGPTERVERDFVGECWGPRSKSFPLMGWGVGGCS